MSNSYNLGDRVKLKGGRRLGTVVGLCSNYDGCIDVLWEGYGDLVAPVKIVNLKHA